MNEQAQQIIDTIERQYPNIENVFGLVMITAIIDAAVYNQMQIAPKNATWTDVQAIAAETREIVRKRFIRV